VLYQALPLGLELLPLADLLLGQLRQALQQQQVQALQVLHQRQLLLLGRRAGLAPWPLMTVLLFVLMQT
jgi:hypothetical protein